MADPQAKATQRQVLQLRLEQPAQALAAEAAEPDDRSPERAAKVDTIRRRRLLEQRGQAVPLPLLPMRHSASN
jgi:hypothetical protein